VKLSHLFSEISRHHFSKLVFHCILQFHLISLLNRKSVVLYLCYFVLIICSHFFFLIKSRSVVSERSAPCRLNAGPQRGWNTKSWVSSLFLLRTKSLARPRNLSWQEKRKMTGHEILSTCFLKKPSCNRGTRSWIVSRKSFGGYHIFFERRRHPLQGTNKL
jgi:hypothetical protein